MNRTFNRMGAIGAVMLAIAFIISGLLWVAGNNVSGTPTGSGPSATPTMPASDECWPVQFNKVTKSGRFIPTGLTGATPAEDAAQLLEAASHDPGALEAYYELFLAKKVKYSSLYKDGCYTAKGKKIYRQLEAYLVASQFDWGKVSSGCNTYNYGSGNVTVVCGPIKGNNDSLIIVGADGKTHYVLRRCANGVTKAVPPASQPGAPPKTHKPPKTTPPTTAPPTTKPPTTAPPSCPPGQVGTPPNCLTPKDPSKDVNKNTEVPPAVRGPGTGVTAPAEQPTDSPCGYAVCTTTEPAAPAQSTPPSGGGPTTLAPPTEPATPASDTPTAPITGTPDDF